MKNLITVLAIACPIASAYAADLGIAGEFNAFVFGSANLVGAESEGAVAVGGSFSSSQAFNISLNSTASSLPTNANNVGLYVGGAASVAGGQLHAGKVLNGNAYIGGSFTSNNFQVQNGLLNPGGSSIDPTVFTNAYADLSALSNALAGLDAVNYSINEINNPEVNLATNTLNGDLKVFNINASDLSNLGTLQALNFTGNETIVFNVYGTNVQFNRNWQEKNSGFGNLTQRTLWNFVDADTISNQRQLNGSVLAVDATFNQGEVIEGNLIVGNWNQSQAREIHTKLFDGDLESVPEPMTMGMLALLALRRRKKKAQAK